ncbi:MAG: hypothetical protein NC203_04475 [Firmicutes bacterium]|nr:hypothetical protein [[Eubacterium] siraeum]MCM1487606.1 hypothetical protein [Bacillota bacterium]
MKKFLKAAAAFIVSAALFIPQTAVSAAAADPSNTEAPPASQVTVIDYEAVKQGGLTVLNSVSANSRFDMYVTLNSQTEITSVIKPVDGFKCSGDITVSANTEKSDEYVAIFNDCLWTGGDKSFGFTAKLSDGSQSSRSFDVACRDAAADSDPEPTSAEPMFKINAKDISTIKAGENGSFTVKLENLGSVKVSKILAEITAPDDVIITDETDSQEIRRYPNDTEFTVRYRAMDKISSPKQVFNITLRYYYTNGNAEMIGSANAVVNVPAEMTEEAAAAGDPMVRITGQSLSSPIAAKSEYNYTLTLRNHGDVDVKDVYIALEGSDAIYFTGGTENGHIDSIAAGKTANLNVKLHTTDNISAIKQSISASVSYSYTVGGVKKTAETAGSITVIAKVSEDVGSSGGSAPNIIIRGYDIGSEQIAAGENFDLNLEMFNTNSAVKVENLIMTVSASDAISIYGGSNTFFYPSLAAGGTSAETIPLKALATAATGISSINVSFKYDYVKDGVASSGSSEQSIFIPVYQPDKMSFEISSPTYTVYPGNETYITTQYLNKGRSDISNVKAEIVGDIQALSTSKVIGNVAPGANGTFDFVVTPYEGGTCEFTIRITYEDAMLEEVTKEFPVSFQVEDMGGMDDWGGDIGWEDPGFDDPYMTEDEGGFPWIVLWIGIGVLVVGGIVAIIVVKKKKKKKNILTEADINWEDDDLEKVLSGSGDEKEKTKV